MERLKLLYLGKVISKKTYDLSLAINEKLEETKSSNELKERFITHLAMALNRIENHEKVGEMDDLMWAEIKKSEGYNKSIDFINSSFSSAVTSNTLFENEKKYLVLHLSSML